MMIFVSSACVRSKKIIDSLSVLYRYGYENIELSGGGGWYPGLEDDLVRFKDENGVNYLIHNYFPPPREGFALNLASLDDKVYESSLSHCRGALKLAARLGVESFGVHAGFRMDPRLSELGKVLSGSKLYDRGKCFSRFLNALESLAEEAADLGVELLVENNPLSKDNYRAFNHCNPFLLTTFNDYIEFRSVIDGVPLLFDLAHLKITCNTLEINLADEFAKMSQCSNYWHISENNGETDAHRGFTEGSHLYRLLAESPNRPDVVTMETHVEIDEIARSFELLRNI